MAILSAKKASRGGEAGFRPLPFLALLLGLLPIVALWTYPGWPRVATGYTPYFNLHRWMVAPSLLWTPPYAVKPPIPVHIPLSNAVAGIYVGLGGSPLGGLRFAATLAIVMAALGVFLWLRETWGHWPAMAAALVWAYSPATIALAFHLGHLGELWLWAGVAWMLALYAMGARTRRAVPAGNTWLALSAVGVIVTWGALLWPGWDGWLGYPWRGYTLVWGGAALASAPAVAWTVRLARRWAAAWLIAFILAAIAARLTLVAAPPTYSQYVPPPAPVAVFGDDALVLLDAQVEGVPAPGHTITITTTWQALQPQAIDWTTFTQVLGPNDRIWGQQDKPTGGDYPTSRWQVGEVVTDTYEIAVDAAAPSSLRLIMGLYNRSTLQRLPTQTGSDHVELWSR